jgi:hypothetical protein
MKNLFKLGRNILEVEVTNISNHGLWILTQNKELFLSYENFPWFKNKTIDNITKVESFGQGHLYWEDLDVDLSLEMIEHPERFPLQAKVT